MLYDFIKHMSIHNLCMNWFEQTYKHSTYEMNWFLCFLFHRHGTMTFDFVISKDQ